MNKSKSSLIFQINQTEGNSNSNKSSIRNAFNSTLPSIHANILNGFFYESFIEKYNEKINLWQKCYLCVKRNYIYLYDKKPKLLDKPKEFLFINNKITLTFHKKLFKMKTIKCFVVNFRINNEALSKSVIEDNNHNLFISFKTQKNFDTFTKVIDNVLKCKHYTNSVSPNQFGIRKEQNLEKDEKNEKNEKLSIKNNVSTDKKMKKNLTSFHLKNKSLNEISIRKSLIFSESSSKNKEKNKNEKQKIFNDNSQCSNNKINSNSANKTNNSIHNVFTFSKVENLSSNTNNKKLDNSNNNQTFSPNNTKSNNKNSNLNNNEKNIFLEKNNINNSKKKINFFTVNFTENNSKIKNNNIFDRDETNNNIFESDDTSLTLSRIPKLIYSIRRKREKEKEDILIYKKQRTKSCYGFNINNIFLQKEENPKEDKIKKIKIKLKDFHTYSNANPKNKINLNISNYSHKEKNIDINYQENQDNSDTTNISLPNKNQSILNNIEEEKNYTESKSKKENNNTNMSFGSLKSFKSESKEEENNENNGNNNNDFDGLDIYSYVDDSVTTKNKSNRDSNPLSSLNIPNIRNQITSIIKQSEEEIITQQDNENSDIIFTPRLMEEIQQQEITTLNSNNKNKYEKEIEKENEKENENYCKDINNNSKKGKIEITSNQSSSNIINTSITQSKQILRFSNDLNDLLESLNTKKYKKSSEKTNTIQSNHSISDNNDININDIYINNSNNNTNEKEKNSISKISNKSLEKSFNYSMKSVKSNEKEHSINLNKNTFKLSIPFNSFFNVNLNFNFMNFSFDCIDQSNIKELLYKIDNNLLFIYDSNILYLLLKKIKNHIEFEKFSITKDEIEGKITKCKILGKIYESLNNKYIKYFILCEMIAMISKKELSKLIITSIEIYNKKKEINQNEPMIDFDEYIYEIFNKYLSRNENNKEYINLYENILPKEIKKIFEIKDSEGSLINAIKQNIHPYTLFNSMQYHNKIYIHINLDNNDFFNYNLLKPFDKNSNHYISPYILEKWKYKSSLNNKNNGNMNMNNEIDLKINNNYNSNNTNPINESFDSNGNYSRDMSNTSLSCIIFDKNNKFRVSLISKSNEPIINNNICYGLFKKEKNIYEEYKIYEKTEEIQKINLFQNIILNINQNEINSAMKNCEYFLQKYQNSTLFLHPLIYLCLAFIHNKIDGLDSAQQYIKKSLKYLTWLFPSQNCFLFYEIEFKYLLIILNNEENIIRNNIENITNIFIQCNNLWNKYYNDKKNCELKLYEIIFKIYFKITDNERNDGNFLNDLFYNNIKPLMNELEQKNKDMNLDCYWKLFIEFFKNCPGCGIMVFNDLIRSVPTVDN